MKDYKIAQILYIISNKSAKVIPVQIEEINQKTTINGKEVIYMIKSLGSDILYNLDSIDGTVFSNPQEVSQLLKENANNAIDKMLSSLMKSVQQKFGNASIPAEPLAGMDIFGDNGTQKNKALNNEFDDDEDPPYASFNNEVVVMKDGQPQSQKIKIGKIVGADGQVKKIN